LERDPVSKNNEVWIIDTQLNDKTRLTFKSGGEGDVVWSPDGLRVGFDSLRSGNSDIYEKEIDSIQDASIVIAESENEWMEDWSQDGKYIIYLATDGLTQSIRALPLSEDQEPFTIIESTSDIDEPHLSFDGKWLAYNSNKSRTWEVYITPFSETAGQEYKISTGSGVQPRWRKDGKELYYLTLDGKMMAVDIMANTKIVHGKPTELFDTKLSVDPIRDQYDVSSDGKRFLLLKPLAEAESTPITVTFNWTKLLNQ
jgi:Tol biopolymer transport system component